MQRRKRNQVLQGSTKTSLRQGNQNVDLWRCFHLFRASRGNQDLIRWVGKFLVTKKSVLDVGMDLHEPVDETDPMFGPNYQQRTNEMIQAGLQPVPVTDALNEWTHGLYNSTRKGSHSQTTSWHWSLLCSQT